MCHSLRSVKMKYTLVIDLRVPEVNDNTSSNISSVDFSSGKAKFSKTINEKEIRKWRKYVCLLLLLLFGWFYLINILVMFVS